MGISTYSTSYAKRARPVPPTRARVYHDTRRCESTTQRLVHHQSDDWLEPYTLQHLFIVLKLYPRGSKPLFYLRYVCGPSVQYCRPFLPLRAPRLTMVQSLLSIKAQRDSCQTGLFWIFLLGGTRTQSSVAQDRLDVPKKRGITDFKARRAPPPLFEFPITCICPLPQTLRTMMEEFP